MCELLAVVHQRPLEPRDYTGRLRLFAYGPPSAKKEHPE